MDRSRRFTAVVAVKTTSVSGHVVLTEAGAALQGHDGAAQQQVT
jgi:hypothetical protein